MILGPSALFDIEPNMCDFNQSSEPTEEQLKDPQNTKGIERSRAYQELMLRCRHAQEMALFQKRHADLNAGKKKSMERLSLAIKLLKQLSARLTRYQRRFARAKILRERRRAAKSAALRLRNQAEADLHTSSCTSAARKQTKNQRKRAIQEAMQKLKPIANELDGAALAIAAQRAYTAAASSCV